MKQPPNDAVDVCVITTIHPPFDARIYEREIKTLLERNFSVCLVSPWKKPNNPWLKHKWVSIKSPKRRIDRIFHGYRTFKAAYNQKAKVYLIHDVDFILWGLLLKLLKRVPVVYDCHENNPEEILYNKEWIPLFLRRPLAFLFRHIENWAVKKYRYCLSVVPHQIKRFNRLGVHPVLVRNFSNWKIRRDLSHKKGLVCSGTLSPPYGIYVLLDIGKKLKKRKIDISLIVTDRFPSKNLEHFFRMRVQQEHLPIKILPQVESKNIHVILKKANIGLAVEQNSPATKLAIPTKIFEYMAMGLPIVASNLPYTQEIIKRANCGIIVPANKAEEYIEAALSLFNDKEKFEVFRENGFKAVEELYNWKNEEKRFVSLFKKLVTLSTSNKKR